MGRLLFCRDGLLQIRSRSRPLRKDWEQVKDEIMLEAVYTKFKQHKDIRKLLLETGNAILVEHTDRDSYWGDGGDGSGKVFPLTII